MYNFKENISQTYDQFVELFGEFFEKGNFVNFVNECLNSFATIITIAFVLFVGLLIVRFLSKKFNKKVFTVCDDIVKTIGEMFLSSFYN